ncbi:hypothetical protein G7Y89_g9312 [Cudoniella acicularis]|uniref:Uncharacterized protein n=1 Tax=Cudoniella acicularis TaxID=354080 RepID=A0A8H4RH76_9HELO|nr:hypothetical protein G7Y89_g9312 [Cudoniella acicularis]
MAQESHPEIITGKIIAGSLAADGMTNGCQEIFNVPGNILEKSLVIKFWIENPGEIPISLQGNDALNFPYCDPEVVRAVISYLEGDTSKKEYKFDFDDKVGATSSTMLYRQNPIFYLRIYKLATTLSLGPLCIAAIQKIRTRKYYEPDTFLQILTEVKSGGLIDSKPFRDWIIEYMAQQYDALCESPCIKGVIKKGGTDALELFGKMMHLFKMENAVLSTPETVGGVASPSASTTGTPSSSSKSSGSPPSITRQSRLYLKSYQKSPSSNANSHRVEKKHREGNKRNLNASVEDAVE